MKAKINIIAVAITVVFAVLIFSCESIMNAADDSAKRAGDAGLIRQERADAISASARTIGSAAEQITPEQEYYIGRAVAANILATYRIWNGNPALTTYLNNICMAITINSPRPNIYKNYRVAILDSNEINAFATSGGHIFVTRGLLRAAKSEDALAAVIAHEVAHIQLKHGIKAIRSSRINQALADVSATAIGNATGMNVSQLTSVFNESVGDIMRTMVNSGYSHVQEYEADNMALTLLASAGYNPLGLVEILQELRKAQSRNSGFGKTHPSPAVRITSAERNAGYLRVTDNSASRRTRFTTATRTR